MDSICKSCKSCRSWFMVTGSGLGYFDSELKHDSGLMGTLVPAGLDPANPDDSSCMVQRQS